MGNPQMGLTDSAPERNYLFEILPGDGQTGSYTRNKTFNDAVHKSAGRKFHHIGNDKRPTG